MTTGVWFDRCIFHLGEKSFGVEICGDASDEKRDGKLEKQQITQRLIPNSDSSNVPWYWVCDRDIFYVLHPNMQHYQAWQPQAEQILWHYRESHARLSDYQYAYVFKETFWAGGGGDAFIML